MTNISLRIDRHQGGINLEHEYAVTCFTDLKNSTAMTEELGAKVMDPMREEYLRVGKILANNCGGTYKKNTGDGYVIVFNGIEAGFRFAAQLQQYYHPQPNYSKEPLVSRVGLFLGVIGNTFDDVFGSGVNQAARTEAAANPGEILVNQDLARGVEKIWAKDKTDRFLSRAGQYEFKGIRDPVELLNFNWQEYIKEYSEGSLSSLVFKHFGEASITPANARLADIASLPSIIWPVVPRDGVNAIHRGQLEIIRLLAMMGSKVHVLIADCGVAENYPRPYSEEFRKMIDDYIPKRNLKAFDYHFMSDLFIPGCKGCSNFHRHFQDVISKLTLEQLLDINRKGHKDVMDAINAYPTLDFLRPALTIASVLHLSDQFGGKCIVVAGYDELKQWEGAHTSIQAARNQFGVLFNPILNTKQGFQGHQKKDWPLYFSWDQIYRDMDNYDLAVWFTKLHLFLSSFPAPSVVINGVSIFPDVWQDDSKAEEQLFKKVDKVHLAKHIFNQIF